MGTGYAQAELVISWLGPHNDNAAIAVEAIVTIARELPPSPTVRVAGEMAKHEQDAADFRVLEKVSFLYEEERSGAEGNKTWMAVLNFFNLPCWSRIWIYQEVVLARHCVFTCGPRTSLLLDQLLRAEAWALRMRDHRPADKPQFLSPSMWQFFTGIGGTF
ncbi:het-domain protein [Fusarium beomiforme]|uniref:Het-domain protein n=1 Tax=Fusarium beomiforme TaxID=44412 RepID=A0A9P5DKT1_9HYPO|nr:het-domain protein [Fusarium beomiforme]